MGEAEKKTCACISWDAQLCYEIRYNVESEDNDERDVCECACHDQEDERNGSR